MINFMNDYNSPGHPAVLKALTDAADNKYVGYGRDEATKRACDKILALLGGSGASVHFIPGGTQTNLTAIAAFLRPHEAVIAPGTSHINVHETGAIECAGHKILLAGGELPDMYNDAGKLTAEAIEKICRAHTDEHMVKPRLAFISQSTELGTIYRLNEIKQLREACDEFGLLLYMDGARLASALTAPGNDLFLPDIAELCDAFYIGGTKNGLLFGEALVITNAALDVDFRYYIKQRGGLLAKGFLMGLQFDAIMDNGLYFDIARHANEMAARLRSGMEALGYRFRVNSHTNQIFPIISKDVAEMLAQRFLFEVWEAAGAGEVVIRLVASWNTTLREIDEFLCFYEKIHNN